jgi:uncharacterized protein (DUF305 family)
MTCRHLPALAVLGALLLAGCGSGDGSSRSRANTTGNPVDRAFVAQMIPHHRSAVQMAQIARRRGSSPFVKRLAGDIVRTQSMEISTMRAADRRLRDADVATGVLGIPQHAMGMSADVASLERATPFDAAFMRMMLPHHQGAVVMANAELARGEDLELTSLARRIVVAQRREIAEMRPQLAKSAGGRAPAGSSGMPADHGGAMHGAGHSG